VSAPYREAAPDLGPLVRTHRDDSDSGCFVVAFAVVCALVAIAMAVTANWWGLALDALGVGAGVWAMRRPGRPAPGVIDVHEKGLLLRVGKTTTAIPFEDVRSVTSTYRQRGRFGARTERHRVEARDGRHIEFGTSWRLQQDLLAAIEERTLPRLRTEALRAFDAGEPVRFGPFTLTEEGVGCDGQALMPWRDAVRITVQDGVGYPQGERTIEVWKADVWEKKGKSYAARTLASSSRCASSRSSASARNPRAARRDVSAEGRYWQIPMELSWKSGSPPLHVCCWDAEHSAPVRM
jgi:hypothetical protein